MSLFDRLVFKVVPSENFHHQDVEAVTALILSHGGSINNELFQKNSQESEAVIQDEHQFIRGHIVVADSIDFPEYGYLEDNLISIVTSDWVHTCIEENLLVPLRPFSPDPKYVLSHIFVCVSDQLTKGDREALYGGVGALGGLFSDIITPYTTHLIALSLDDAKAKLVREKLSRVKVVLPHWIDDCLKLKRRLDETPYAFPNPPILQGIVSTATPPDPNNGLYLSPHGDRRQPLVASKSTVFKGRIVCFGLDLELSQRAIAAAQKLVHAAGGETTDDVFKANVYIGQYRDGAQYLRASLRRLFVGNLTWLYWIIFNNKWASPLRKLLHYPLAKHGIPGMHGKVISLTNYTGESRRYLEQLIIASGAKYTNALSSNNTHLIAASPKGEKFVAARRWGVHVVNHLWLEESYASWDVQVESLPRYSQIANRLNLNNIAGQTQLISGVLKHFHGKIDVPIVQETVSLRPTPFEDPSSGPAQPRDSVPRQTEVTIAKSNLSGRMTPENQLVDTKDLSSEEQEEEEEEKVEKDRHTALVAESALTETPAIEHDAQFPAKNSPSTMHTLKRSYTYPEEELPRVDVPSSPLKQPRDLYTEVQTKIANISPKVAKISSATPASNSPSQVKSPADVRSPKKQLFSVLITGLDEDYDPKMLRKIGIDIISDPEKARVVVAPRVLRTEKFLCAMSVAEHIVTPNYLDDCLIAEKAIWPIPESYELKDSTLTLALKRAKTLRDTQQSLFEGITFNVVGSIRGGYHVFDHIVRCQGANPSTEIKNARVKKYSKTTQKDSSYYVLIATDDDDKIINSFSKVDQSTTHYIKDFEWILTCIRTMEIKL